MPIQRIPIWKENENRNLRQQAMRDFMDANAALADSLTGAGSTQSSGIADLVARAALKRIRAAAATKNTEQAAIAAANAARDKELAAIKERMAFLVELASPPVKDADKVDVTV